jgi:hypothetical protein
MDAHPSQVLVIVPDILGSDLDDAGCIVRHEFLRGGVTRDILYFNQPPSRDHVRSTYGGVFKNLGFRDRESRFQEKLCRGQAE